MKVRCKKFNIYKSIPNDIFTCLDEIVSTIESHKLHLKKSDQRGIVGTPIFDPVGTNESIKQSLVDKDWIANIPIPEEYKFLGSDIDFEKNGILVEVQFSNYPFLLNNLLRSEIFYKSNFIFSKKKTAALIIVTKAKMFPASNSTLYFEQAENQISSLLEHSIFSIPIILIGMFENHSTDTLATWTEYSSSRYSRSVNIRKDITCKISKNGARSKIVISDI